MQSRKWTKWMSWPLATALMLSLATACSSGGGSGTGAPSGGSDKAAVKSSDSNAKGTDSATAEKSSDKGEFTIWTWDLNHPTLMDAFHKKYPDIKINVVNVPDGDMLKKVQTTIASGGELPEIIRIDRQYTSKYVEMDVLEDLEQAPYHADKTLLFDYAIKPSENAKGKMIAVPEDMSVSGLMYKKNLAKQYFGTDDPKELEAMFPTWDAFVEKGKDVLAKSGGKVKMFASLDDVYTVMKGQRSTPYFDGDKMNVDTFKDVFNKVIQFRDAGIVDKMDAWTPAWNASYTQDTVIFYPGPVWAPQFVIGPNDKSGGARWGLLTPPGGGFIDGGSAHGILKNSKNKELAYKWLEFEALTQEGADALKKDGVFTHYKKAYDDKSFASWKWPNFGDQDIGIKFFTDISAKTKDPGTNNNDITLGEVTTVLVQALSRDKSMNIDGIMNKLKSEMKAKAPNVTIQ